MLSCFSAQNTSVQWCRVCQRHTVSVRLYSPYRTFRKFYDRAAPSSVPRLRRSVAGLSLLRPRHDSIPVHVGSVFHKVAMRQVFLRVRRLPCRYHFTSAPYSFIHLAPTLCNLRNWQRRSVTLLKHLTSIYAIHRQFKHIVTKFPNVLHTAGRGFCPNPSSGKIVLRGRNWYLSNRLSLIVLWSNTLLILKYQMFKFSTYNYLKY